LQVEHEHRSKLSFGQPPKNGSMRAKKWLASLMIEGAKSPEMRSKIIVEGRVSFERGKTKI
jgi:hypothetical protein